MRIFLSWSGARSRAVASVFRNFLPRIVQAFDPWLSSEDLAKGTNWIDQVSGALRESNGVGLFFITKEAQESRWIHFEAGAVAALGHARVCVVRVGMELSDVASPLNLFQSTALAREDVRKLVLDINSLLPRPVAESNFEHFFDAAWPGAEKAINEALQSTSDAEFAVAAPHLAARGVDQGDVVESLRGIGERLSAIERQLSVASNPYLTPIGASVGLAPPLSKRWGLSIDPVPTLHPELDDKMRKIQGLLAGINVDPSEE